MCEFTSNFTIHFLNNITVRGSFYISSLYFGGYVLVLTDGGRARLFVDAGIGFK